MDHPDCDYAVLIGSRRYCDFLCSRGDMAAETVIAGRRDIVGGTDQYDAPKYGLYYHGSAINVVCILNIHWDTELAQSRMGGLRSVVYRTS